MPKVRVLSATNDSVRELYLTIGDRRPFTKRRLLGPQRPAVLSRWRPDHDITVQTVCEITSRLTGKFIKHYAAAKEATYQVFISAEARERFG